MTKTCQSSNLVRRVPQRRWWARLIVIGLVSGSASASWATPYNFTTIDVPGATSTNASGINNAGQIVGSAALPPGAVAPGTSYIGWELNGGTFTPLTYPGAIKTCGVPAIEANANGINDNGVVAGQYSVSCSTPRYGFTESGGAYTSFSVAPGISTTIHGLNDSGDHVGSSYLHTPGRTYSGFLNDGGIITAIDAPGANITMANGINNAGQVVGHYDNQGFIYVGGVLTTVSAAGALVTHLSDINNNGLIAGWLQNAGGAYLGFTYAGGVFNTFSNPLGVNGTFASGLNDLGQIVGFYIDASNVTHGFLADPVSAPAPAALALLGFGLAAICLRRRRRSAR